MIGSPLPIFLLIDGLKTGLRLLNGKAGGKPIVPIVLERRSLVNLYRISMQKDSYEYGGTHFWRENPAYVMKRIHFLRGNPNKYAGSPREVQKGAYL